METDKVENIEKVSTLEGARGCDKNIEENSQVTNEEFEECRERRSKNRSENGLEFGLEIGMKKRQTSLKDLRWRINTIYESLREPVDFIKLNAYKDGLEAALNTFQTAHEKVTDLLMRLELPRREQEKQHEFLEVNNAALECLAEVKVKIKDQEMERVELISQKSLRSRRSASSIRSSSTTSSKRAAIETAKIKAKLETLKRRQEIERRRDELKFQEKELERLEEQKELHGELSAAKAIQKILQESELTRLFCERPRKNQPNKPKKIEFPTLRQPVDSKRKGVPAWRLRKRIIKLMILLLSER